MRPSELRLDLESYCCQIAELPTPTPEQIDAFARFVAKAHSWYKGIPLLRCEIPFVFFLDPAAGCDRMLGDDGTWRILPREQRGVHHNSLPTREYHERYGHLRFAWGPTIEPDPEDDLEGVVSESGDGATIVGPLGGRWRIPQAVEEASTVYLSGVVHPWANQPFGWAVVARSEARPGVWPEESGGLAAFAAIQARCRELVATPSSVVRGPPSRESETGADAILAELLAPERRRQHEQIVSGIERLLALAARAPGA
jgi:hypothetical protein